MAKDMAGSEVGLTGTATATITITDKNDHAPEFTHPLVRNVPHPTPPLPYLLLLNDAFSFQPPCRSHAASADVNVEKIVFVCTTPPGRSEVRVGTLQQAGGLRYERYDNIYCKFSNYPPVQKLL